MDYEQRLKVAAKIILDSDSKAELPAVNCEIIGLTASLKPHQVEGVSWLIRRYNLGVNVILGTNQVNTPEVRMPPNPNSPIQEMRYGSIPQLEFYWKIFYPQMGLGKTLQAVAFMCYLKACLMSPGPFLVLCPLSVTDGWVSETKLFAPKLRVLRYIGGKEHRLGLRRFIYEHVMANHSASDVPLLPFDVLLTTYDIALMDQDFLSQFAWRYVVIDEAQRLKNPSSVLYNVLRDKFVMPRRLLMTGTPIQNNLAELWALLHFCMPSVFGSLEQFLHTFKEVGDPSGGYDGFKERGKLRILKSVLAALMLRRTKSELIECGTLVLPPLTEITMMVPLVALQKKVYASILRNELPKLLAFASGTSNFQSLQNMVIQLRKACSHPYLFPGIEPEPYEEGEHLIQASGKLIILDQLLQRLHGSGHRVLLFAQMTHTLDILQDFLEYRQYSYERLDGSVRAEERFAAIRSFSQQSSADENLKSDANGAFVFMISTRAGGVGLNLVAADTVIFYEQDWNPQVDRQALQRAHRIGQMNHVMSISLVTGKTVEEVIMRRAQRKLQLSHDVVGEDIMEHVGNESSGSEPGDMRSIIYGLHMFDPTDVNDVKLSEPNLSELSAMVDMVISKRHVLKADDNVGKLEISTKDLKDGESGAQISFSAVKFEPGVDEASYNSWVEKFKEESKLTDNLGLELENRRKSQEEKLQKTEAARKRAGEKKLAKWQSLGYVSLSVTEPGLPSEKDVISDRGAVHFVVGDCTKPSTHCPSEPSIIFFCVDDSGIWGHGGMFDSLAKLSTEVPRAYELASEFKDLHLGDLHLIRVDEDECREVGSKSLQWVALAIVQSFNPRRKVPRSSISVPNLDCCLRKASFSAAQHSASIHMPRIGYQDGSDRAVWYSTERLLRKYASIYGINIYVYYYRRL